MRDLLNRIAMTLLLSEIVGSLAGTIVWAFLATLGASSLIIMEGEAVVVLLTIGFAVFLFRYTGRQREEIPLTHED